LRAVLSALRVGSGSAHRKGPRCNPRAAGGQRRCGHILMAIFLISTSRCTITFKSP
jgi:hypothetical protein